MKNDAFKSIVLLNFSEKVFSQLIFYSLKFVAEKERCARFDFFLLKIELKQTSLSCQF